MLKWVKMFTFFIVRAEEVDPPHNQPDRKKVVILILPFNRVRYVKKMVRKWCHMVCAVWVSSNFVINLCAAPMFQSICLIVNLERIVDIQESHVTTSCQAV